MHIFSNTIFITDVIVHASQ